MHSQVGALVGLYGCTVCTPSGIRKYTRRWPCLPRQFAAKALSMTRILPLPAQTSCWSTPRVLGVKVSAIVVYGCGRVSTAIALPVAPVTRGAVLGEGWTVILQEGLRIGRRGASVLRCHPAISECQHTLLLRRECRGHEMSRMIEILYVKFF